MYYEISHFFAERPNYQSELVLEFRLEISYNILTIYKHKLQLANLITQQNLNSISVSIYQPVTSILCQFVFC